MKTASKILIQLLMPIMWTACAIMILTVPDIDDRSLRIFLSVVCICFARLELTVSTMNTRRR